TLVEFAFICPLLFLLIFGIIDFGSAYNDLISLRQGVREGARQGSVGVFGGPGCRLQSGLLGSPETRRLMCLTKNRIGSDDADLGNARQTRRQAQNAADAAALAAAVVVAQQPDAPNVVRAVADAKRYVFSNYGDVVWAGCTDTDALNYKPEPTNQCISFNDTQ